jgi:hypothetical protein
MSLSKLFCQENVTNCACKRDVDIPPEMNMAEFRFAVAELPCAKLMRAHKNVRHAATSASNFFTSDPIFYAPSAPL